MRYSTTLIVAAALTISETMAGPVGHAHLHRHAQAHEKKDVVDWKALDWNAMGIDWTKAWAEGQASKTTSVTEATNSPIIALEVKASTTAVAPVRAAATSTSSSAKATATKSITSSLKTLWSDIKGCADDFTEFGGRTTSSGTIIGKIGNIGSPQGSNMIKVDAVGDYKYTNTFVNTQDKTITIAVWNKGFEKDTGEVLANLGAMVAPITPILSITLGAGESQVVAFDEDTQAGWAEATEKIHLSGSYETTWAEINYVETGCGFDVSAIMNYYGNTYDMEMSALETDCVSNMVDNLWIARNGNMEDPVPVGDSDGSCFIPAGKCTVTTKFGGQQ